MARAIIRYSFSHEKANTSGNEVRKRLEAVGFERQERTACFEVAGAPLESIHEAIDRAFEIFEHPLEGPGELDHVWIYADLSG